MGGSSKPQTTHQVETINQTATPTPYDAAKPALDDLIKQAQAAYSATPKTPVYTGMNTTQLQAADLIKSLAPGLSAGAGAIGDNAAKTAGGYYLNNNPLSGVQLGANPFQLGATNSNVNDLIQSSLALGREQLDKNVLSIGDAAKMAGAYGGDRQDLLRGTALRGYATDSANLSANIKYQAEEAAAQRALQAWQAEQANTLSLAGMKSSLFSNERNNQMQAPGQFAAANELALAPATVLQALGDRQSSSDVAAATAAMDAPWAGLDRYQQIVNTYTPYASQTTTGTNTTDATTQGAKGSKTAGAVSGAIGGASAGAAFGPWGAGIGAVLGGLGGLFG